MCSSDLIMPGAKWLEMLLQHVPDRGEHLVLYYGWVSQDRSSSERTQPGEREDMDVRAGVVVTRSLRHGRLYRNVAIEFRML